jgi:hypothetical protein
MTFWLRSSFDNPLRVENGVKTLRFILIKYFSCCVNIHRPEGVIDVSFCCLNNMHVTKLEKFDGKVSFFFYFIVIVRESVEKAEFISLSDR